MYFNNKLGYLGFLGLIGLIGFVGNFYFFGFFGFLVYFRYFSVIPDELFKKNVRKSASPSFFVSITISALIAGYGALTQSISAQYLATGLAMNFAIPIFVFTGILVNSEFNEVGDED